MSAAPPTLLSNSPSSNNSFSGTKRLITASPLPFIPPVMVARFTNTKVADPPPRTPPSNSVWKHKTPPEVVSV